MNFQNIKLYALPLHNQSTIWTPQRILKSLDKIFSTWELNVRTVGCGCIAQPGTAI